jgi:hypothetical protein
MNAARQQAAVSRAQAIAPVLTELAYLSARAAADERNRRAVITPTGAPWSAKTVIRARERLGNKSLATLVAGPSRGGPKDRPRQEQR